MRNFYQIPFAWELILGNFLLARRMFAISIHHILLYYTQHQTKRLYCRLPVVAIKNKSNNLRNNSKFKFFHANSPFLLPFLSLKFNKNENQIKFTLLRAITKHAQHKWTKYRERRTNTIRCEIHGANKTFWICETKCQTRWCHSGTLCSNINVFVHFRLCAQFRIWQFSN